MITREQSIRVFCPSCNTYFREQIGRLQEIAVFKHQCGTLLECNLNELDEFVRAKADDPVEYLRLHIRA
jgi:hypothetical protein